ncbi:hypothetical protein COUCH_23345 [Couchioplanes caeruleus]|uniref:hypothetical protein n=1 Tax=Couchioplanes caeruleus TaxID=56438 RepID=UPI0020BE846F|nr:hypothetical protein [Couchioplanes caeruleus]UQU61975.1 hypothetical protein COUCH_23345 [Couchioplanes caeruleus]
MSGSHHDRTARAADLMHLNAMALEETEQSLHDSADRRRDGAGERLHRLADTMTETAGDIAERARGLSDEARKRETRG